MLCLLPPERLVAVAKPRKSCGKGFIFGYIWLENGHLDHNRHNCLCFCQCRFTVARQSDVDAEVVPAFLKNAACHNMLASVTLPQKKGLFVVYIIFVAVVFVLQMLLNHKMFLFESKN